LLFHVPKFEDNISHSINLQHLLLICYCGIQKYQSTVFLNCDIYIECSVEFCFLTYIISDEWSIFIPFRVASNQCCCSYWKWCCAILRHRLQFNSRFK